MSKSFRPFNGKFCKYAVILMYDSIKQLNIYPAILQNVVFNFRDSFNSYTSGVLSKKAYSYGNARRMVSLKLCVVGWLLELMGTVMTLVGPALYEVGIHNHYYVDAIIMFVLIPFIHLTNDEETKGNITDHGWYRGLRDMLGIQNQIAPH